MNIVGQDRKLRRAWRVAIITILFGCAGSLAVSWRVEAQRAPAQASPATQRVLRLEKGRSIGTVPDKGSTYNELEARVTRVRTVFDEGTAVAERDQNGDIAATLSDSSGRQVGTMTFLKATAAPHLIELDIPDKRYVRMTARADLAPTVEWANRQLIAFWKDRSASGIGTSVWQQNVIRPIAAPARDYDAAILEVETHWADGLVARATVGRRVATPRSPAGNRRISAVLMKGDTRLGWVQYFVEDRVLNFAYAGGTTGQIDDAALAQYGGWTFVPDMAWLTMQAYAFYEMPRRSELARQVSFAPQSRVGRSIAAVSNFFVPRLQAQDGCTGLHWLDYTIYRPCCDQHDYCYNKYGCDRYSWRWPFGSAWECTGCNTVAVFCFVTSGGGRGAFYPTM